MIRYNIFWFIIDSVRTFRTGEDDRDRLENMDKFAKDSIEFTNCYTSAPSSKLAAGTMFTGIPSVFVARHFNDWKYTDQGLSTIRTLAEKYNYKTFPLIDGRNAREKYQEFLPPFEKEYLPKDRHFHEYVWNNEKVTQVFNHIMNKADLTNPTAFIMWYDCRRDPKTSYHVQNALQTIKEKGYYENSIIIMNSDHGYPDPRTKVDEGFFKNLGHDMILTDDNIKTPLFLKYPGGPQNVKVENVVGHLDIIPTIFDILNIPMDNVNDKHDFRGKSLVNIIERSEKDVRVIRSDTRLQMDKGKITSFREKSYKFIYFHDEDEYVLFDIKKDPQELHDISKSESTIINNKVNEFFALMSKYEDSLNNYHKIQLKNNFKKFYDKFHPGLNKVLIVSPAPNQLINILIEELVERNKKCEVDLIHSGEFIINNERLSKLLYLNGNEEEIIKKLEKKYTMVIYLTHNSRRVFLKDEIVSFIKKIKANERKLMNYNFDIFEYFSIKSFFSYFRLYFSWDVKGYFYKQEPIYFIKDILFYVKFILFNRVFKDSRVGNNDIMTAREIMHFRKAHLENAKKGLHNVEENEMEYEVKRIKDWGNE